MEVYLFRTETFDYILIECEILPKIRNTIKKKIVETKIVETVAESQHQFVTSGLTEVLVNLKLWRVAADLYFRHNEIGIT